MKEFSFCSPKLGPDLLQIQFLLLPPHALLSPVLSHRGIPIIPSQGHRTCPWPSHGPNTPSVERASQKVLPEGPSRPPYTVLSICMAFPCTYRPMSAPSPLRWQLREWWAQRSLETFTGTGRNQEKVGKHSEAPMASSLPPEAWPLHRRCSSSTQRPEAFPGL